MPIANEPPIVPPQGEGGLTLIELVVTIVVIGLAASAVMMALSTGLRYSADPQTRIKVVELGQSYMDEIFAKPFDDVEDYDGLQEGEGCGWGSLLDAGGDPRRGRYDGYCVKVAVDPGGDDLVGVTNNDDALRIKVEVTDPQENVTPFTAYRLDF